VKPVINDPNKDKTQIFLEYVRIGRGHHGGLIAAVQDCMFMVRWLADAHSLIMLLLEVDKATGILSTNAGGHKIIERMKAHITAYNLAVGGEK
jgi:hypothetical protein